MLPSLGPIQSSLPFVLVQFIVIQSIRVSYTHTHFLKEESGPL